MHFPPRRVIPVPTNLGLAIAGSAIALAIFAPLPNLAAADPADSVAFFESRIRPVLVQRCYGCHSVDADEIGGSLLLDSSGGMLTGGDSGAAIEPGDAEASMLVSALRYESSEMPPDEQLPDHVVDDFVRWINAGATDPRKGDAGPLPKREAIDLEAGRQFWSFQPIGAFSDFSPRSTQDPIPTEHLPTEHRQGLIDMHLLASMRSAGIESANESAAPATRLRRLAFDLTGLPPSEEVMQTWLADPSDSAWARLVESYLASPEYAQHWARHWMDVARYADSNGSDFNATFHEAWRYRDYLIESMAMDRPFDQMIHQQVAGDLLPAENDKQRYDNIVASTFLMLGTKMLSERDKAKLTLDVVDEQIDTIGRAFLGMTLGCVRCHDHKFDPIPTEDYYALAGIFKSTVTLKGESQQYVSTWNRVPLPTSKEHRDAVEQFKVAESKLKKQISESEKQIKRLKSSGAASLEGIIIDDADAIKSGTWKSSTFFKEFVGPGYVHDDNMNKGKATITFQTRVPKSGEYEVRFAYSPNPSRASNVPVTITSADGQHNVTVDQRRAPIQAIWASLGKFRFTTESDAVIVVSNKDTTGYVIADAIQLIGTDDATTKPDSSKSETASKALAAANEQLERLKSELKTLQSKRPTPLPEAMAPSDAATPKIGDSRVHIRGEVNNLGDVVPRGFLQVCSGSDSSIKDPVGSGRLELAAWLTDPDNPLVARVFVNRVWMHLMGEGIVRTVDNFGQRGERPSHPALLDDLATEFIRGGWHIKPLIRKIVMSQAYSRSSEFVPQSYAIDPENRLLWRGHRRRLPAESIRDTMLALAGELDKRGRTQPMKGRGTLVSSNNADSKATFAGVAETCRSIFIPVVRSYVPPLMSSLDAADPDLLVGRRPTTNVPSQALVLINSPDVNRWAEKTAQRIMQQYHEFDDRLMATYQNCLSRAPRQQDREIASEFFGGQADSAEHWHEFIAAIFAGTEFRLLD